MDFDKLNKWLTLIANLGVLVGIIFLSREMDQSNRIAERDGRSELVSQEIDLQKSFLENPSVTELLVKLSAKDPELSKIEIFQAETIAQQFLLRIANLIISYETGFLEGPGLERQIRGILLSIQRFPGITPYIISTMQRMGVGGSEVDSPIFERFNEELRAIE